MEKFWSVATWPGVSGTMVRQESIGGGRLIFSLQPCLSATNFFHPNPSMNSVQSVDKVRTIMIHSPFKSLSVDNQALTHEGHFPLDLNCSHVEIYTGTVLLPRVHIHTRLCILQNWKCTVQFSLCRRVVAGKVSLPFPHPFFFPTPVLVLHKVCTTMKTAPVYGALKPFFIFAQYMSLYVQVICIPLLIAFL